MANIFKEDELFTAEDLQIIQQFQKDCFLHYDDDPIYIDTVRGIEAIDDSKILYEERLPEVDFKDKKTRHVDFAPKEVELNVCKGGMLQMYKCFGNSHDRKNIFDVAWHCRRCPYVKAYAGQNIAGRLQMTYNLGDIEKTINDIVSKADMNTAGCVYFITDGQFVKIGKAIDVIKRLNDLQVGNPKPLQVAAVIKAGDRAVALEGALHDFFCRNSVQGEWFDLNNNYYYRWILDHYGTDCTEVIAYG